VGGGSSTRSVQRMCNFLSNDGFSPEKRMLTSHEKHFYLTCEPTRRIPQPRNTSSTFDTSTSVTWPNHSLSARRPNQSLVWVRNPRLRRKQEPRRDLLSRRIALGDREIGKKVTMERRRDGCKMLLGLKEGLRRREVLWLVLGFQSFRFLAGLRWKNWLEDYRLGVVVVIILVFLMLRNRKHENTGYISCNRDRDSTAGSADSFSHGDICV